MLFTSHVQTSDVKTSHVSVYICFDAVVLVYDERIRKHLLVLVLLLCLPNSSNSGVD